MQIGVSRLVDVTISNTGAIETGPITITAPTLSWLTIASGTTMASIPAGGSATMSLQLRGDDNTALGMPLSGAIAINAAGQTILMVTHSVKAASHAKRVLFIKDGTIFHQLYRGDMDNASLYQAIAHALTALMTGGDRQ